MVHVRTICHNVVVGSVSYASAPKGIMMASTAQEVTVLAPDARYLFAEVSRVLPVARVHILICFQKWNDPNIMPLDPVPGASSFDATKGYPIQPAKSFRTALFLDRFSEHCTIQYCSNDLLIDRAVSKGRPIYDFVVPEDEEKVRKWMDNVKGNGVNQSGGPSVGGFDYGKFVCLVDGRDYR